MGRSDEVRRWYAEHGVEYIPSDWDATRDEETGEGLNPELALPREHERPHIRSEQDMVRLEELGRLVRLWAGRRNHDEVEALDEFLTPYLATLPHAQRRVLDEWMFGRKSHQQVADALGLDRSGVSKRLKAATRSLVRAISQDWPDPEGSDEQRAWAVFETYWRKRFGRSY